MSESNEHRQNGGMGRTISIGAAVGVISGLIGIYVFFKDEITARLFPDQATATKADIKEQLQLSEERISAVVAASVADAIISARASGTDISQDVKVDYEAALTKLLTSDDPALNDAKFLAVAGNAEAAAQNMVTTLSAPASDADTIKPKSRAELLLSAGDILVPTDSAKALAAFEKALELDPGNQVLKTRIQKLREATAAKNEAVAIPNAAFDLGGLNFEFQGCDQPETPRCVFTVMNPTPDPIRLDLYPRQWAIDETGAWVQTRRKSIAANSETYWDVPSLETSQIEFSFTSAANKFQLFRPNFMVGGIQFEKEFRDIAIRGGKQIAVRSMRPVDTAHPEYAYEVAGVKVHFLGCTSADAPVCSFDLINTGNKDVTVEGRSASGYTEDGVQLNSVKSVISLENKRESSAPPGIAFTWQVSFDRQAGMFQSFWPDLRINRDTYPREFRNILIASTRPEVKTMRFDQATSENAVFDIAGLKFAFLGCRNPLTPTCVIDIQNTTGKALSLDLRRPEATLPDGSTVDANSELLEMSSSSSVWFPAGLTTTYEVAFRREMSEIEQLSLRLYVDGDRYDHALTNISVQ